MEYFKQVEQSKWFNRRRRRLVQFPFSMLHSTTKIVMGSKMPQGWALFMEFGRYGVL
jgi:hypothetical protein